MRKLLFTALVIYPFLFLSSQENRDSPLLTKIHAILDERDTEISQWVYWASYEDEGYDIIDSCYVEKGQKSMEMQGYLGERSFYCQLVFSKKGPNMFDLYLSPGEDAKINIRKLQFEGTPATTELHDFSYKRTFLYAKKYRMESELSTITDSLKQIQLADSIKYYEKYINEVILIEEFNKAKTPFFCLFIFYGLSQFIPNETWNSMLIDMKKRFPDYKRIQHFPNSPFKKNENSDKMRERIDRILAEKHGKPYEPASPKKQKEISEELKEQLSAITPYEIGDKVDSLRGSGLSEASISLSDIKTPYVLIDFWASWCSPCIREFPNIKKALENFPNQLSVFAVAINDTQEAWKNSIETRDLGMFIHIYGGKVGSDALEILARRFDVKFIPSNFLLDRDRKIIAVNLKGDQLEKVLRELTIQ